MSEDFEVRGADQFLALSKKLKAEGETGLRKELNKSLRDAAKPLIAKTRAATSRLPQSGGLAARVKKAPQRVQVRTGKDPGVRIAVPKLKGAGLSANRGTVRHPVFGNREVFVDQPVAPGWFDEPIKAGAADVRGELEKALNRVAERVANK